MGDTNAVPDKTTSVEPSYAPAPSHRRQGRETWYEQFASFVGFFVYLLILKTFFLPLFIIPTGSMAETLYGAHAIYTCPNCGVEYPIGWQPQGVPLHGPYQPVAQCPNCRWRVYHGNPTQLDSRRARPDEIIDQSMRAIDGDRIFVHGWPFDGMFAGVRDVEPDRWDVVVFKVPTDGETNYIKRLIGKPNEKIEIINGDIFVNDEIATKPAHVQAPLWFRYYDHDYPPTEAAGQAAYHPRWGPLQANSPWTDCDTRQVTFDGLDSEHAVLQFATDPDNPRLPGVVENIYAYNEPRQMAGQSVCDVRLSAEIEFQDAAPGGYVELTTSKGFDHFYTRLYAGGKIELAHRKHDELPDTRNVWATDELPDTAGLVRLALLHLDGVVAVEVNGQQTDALRYTPEQYELTPAMARAQSQNPRGPIVQVGAAGVVATLRHLLIERDVYYTSDVRGSRVAFGVQDRPIQLGPDEYFVLGDNSPNSQDARYSFARPGMDPVGPHLKERHERGDYQLGTVPGDQLIGPAFFVYWPGFLPLTPYGPNILPDLGRARWIH